MKLSALHALQKLMARPDAAEVFKQFDTDGDGTVRDPYLLDHHHIHHLMLCWAAFRGCC